MDYYEAHRELEKQCENYGSGRAFAAAMGFSATFINDVRAGREKMSPNLLTALGYKMVCRLEKL